MKTSRIYAMVLRYFYYFRQSLDRMSDAFYWPVMDLLLWGLTGSYFKKMSGGNSTIMIMIISGILFWIIVWRGQYEITVNLLEELWNKNLINLFGSPLNLDEWMVSVIIIGLIKAFLSLSFALVLAFFLYKYNFFVYGFSLIPFILCLIMTGWWVGFLVAGIILRGGTRIQTLAWAAVAVISPFSAIYYPLSVLPLWAQKIASFIPTSYIFEGARLVLAQGYLDWHKILISFLLNIVYLVLAIVWLRKSFDKILRKGLVKLF